MNSFASDTADSATTVSEALLRQLAAEIRKEIPEAEVRLYSLLRCSVVYQAYTHGRRLDG